MFTSPGTRAGRGESKGFFNKALARMFGKGSAGQALASNGDGTFSLQSISSGATSTTLTSSFTQPAIGSTVSASVVSTIGMYVGEYLYVDSGGYYTVSSITNSTTVVIKNLGDSSNAAASATVTNSSRVRDAGLPKIVACAEVVTAESSTSATYANLATAGPSVTLVTGTSVIVRMVSTCYMTTGFAASGSNLHSVDISGATTVAASDTNSGLATPGTNTGRFLAYRTVIITGLTPGTNTFKMMYRTDSSNHTWEKRAIEVTAL